MTAEANTDWQQVAALSDDLQRAWLTEHRDGGDRKEWLRGFVAGTQALDKDDRMRLVGNVLTSLLALNDDEARRVADDFQYVLDHMPGEAAFTEISALQSAARHMPVDDVMRLGQLWPRVFGKDIAATV